MKNKIGILLILVFVVAACSTMSSSVASDNEEEAVRKALDGFYASLNAMFTGDAEAAKAVWSHSDDIAYMGADGGYQVGWKAMYKDWKDQAKLKIGGKVKHKNVHVNVGKDIAVTHQLVQSVDTDKSGVNKHAALRASSVFRKEDGKWKMIGHHVDVIPELKKEIMKEN